MKHLKTITIISLLSVALLSCKTGEKETKPNIVVILCDDLGYGDLSSFGHSFIETPNLDKLAEEGIKCTSFYSAAPVCSPSRAGLLTGRSPNRAGIYDFIPGPKKSEDCRDLVHLQAHEKTIPAMLKTVGYSTCLSGKWHCSSYFNSEKQPTPGYFGFDHWFATHNNAAPSHENPKNFVRNGEDVGQLEGFSCQLVVDEALNWLKEKEADNPFYLQVCFHEPHEPVASPQMIVDKYMPKAENENQAQYFANVENMDKAVGRLISYLEANYSENTLVVFSSDNGPETLNRYSRAKRSYGSPGPLKGMKLWTTEAGFRVPGVLYWLGKETFNGTSDAVISSLDFMPTFAEISGAKLPDVELDGQSMMPLIETGRMERIKPLTWAFYDAINERRVAMRTDDWKIMCSLKSEDTTMVRLHNIYDGNLPMIKNAEMTDFVLYNMKQDISESSDVSEEYPEKFEEMKELLKAEYGNLLDGSFVWNREKE
ncbi:sulfatase-like hydrolase/transferase [uncultured Draconibacterium sp.]|uniref:sulfatase-like hydrolase/transferase n=1 Tax=uncultured Draconibacterium sp. TaxID=1573823 RepID=UPI002AA66FAD|nr:sulfatase-like hydrolase/transferase [uncultured Draconibacterium sp.]